jgi:hypothetical protein
MYAEIAPMLQLSQGIGADQNVRVRKDVGLVVATRLR